MMEDRSTSEVEQVTDTTAKERKGKEKKTSKTLKEVQEALRSADDKYLRLYSEFENFRRREAKEKLLLVETAGKAILKNLLPIVDDFERALAALQAAAEVPQATQAGIRLIHDKLTRLLQQEGVQPIPLDKGAMFDTELCEAVTQLPSEDKAMQGKVLEVIEKGYLLKGKVLRFAKVVIGA